MNGHNQSDSKAPKLKNNRCKWIVKSNAIYHSKKYEWMNGWMAARSQPYTNRKGVGWSRRHNNMGVHETRNTTTITNIPKQWAMPSTRNQVPTQCTHPIEPSIDADAKTRNNERSRRTALDKQLCIIMGPLTKKDLYTKHPTLRKQKRWTEKVQQKLHKSWTQPTQLKGTNGSFLLYPIQVSSRNRPQSSKSQPISDADRSLPVSSPDWRPRVRACALCVCVCIHTIIYTRLSPRRNIKKERKRNNGVCVKKTPLRTSRENASRKLK